MDLEWLFWTVALPGAVVCALLVVLFTIASVRRWNWRMRRIRTVLAEFSDAHGRPDLTLRGTTEILAADTYVCYLDIQRAEVTGAYPIGLIQGLEVVNDIMELEKDDRPKEFIPGAKPTLGFRLKLFGDRAAKWVATNEIVAFSRLFTFMVQKDREIEFRTRS